MKRELFLAVDINTRAEAIPLVHKLGDYISAIKVGPRLSIKYGASLIQELAKVKPVFVDNKYFDIPNTMAASVQSTFEAGASYCTVHAQAGEEALKLLADLEAKLNEERFFKILVVTVLTSFTQESLPVTQIKAPISKQVHLLAEQAYNCGLKSFVCSAHEVELLRSEFPEAYLVTPGIRFNDEASRDQKRVVEPEEAFQSGTNAIVVGRPICNARDVEMAAKKYHDVLKG